MTFTLTPVCWTVSISLKVSVLSPVFSSACMKPPENETSDSVCFYVSESQKHPDNNKQRVTFCFSSTTSEEILSFLIRHSFSSFTSEVVVCFLYSERLVNLLVLTHMWSVMDLIEESVICSSNQTFLNLIIKWPNLKSENHNFETKKKYFPDYKRRINYF